MQFIAATHSPILFAATDKLWLIDVEEDEVRYSESRCGYDANSVLEIFMGAKSKNSKTEELIHSIYVAIQNQEYKLAEERIEKLESITSENYPDVIMARMELKRRVRK